MNTVDEQLDEKVDLAFRRLHHKAYDALEPIAEEYDIDVKRLGKLISGSGRKGVERFIKDILKRRLVAKVLKVIE